MIGIAAGLGASITWAIASTFLGSQTARMDTISLMAMRAVWGTLTFTVALFAVGAHTDLIDMPFDSMWQLAGAGFLASGTGDALYAAAFFLLGMSRAFTIVTALNVLLAFALASIFLGETATVPVGVGAGLILIGVFLVALYGQPQGGGSLATGSAPSEARPRFRLRRSLKRLTIAGDAPPPVQEPEIVPPTALALTLTSSRSAGDIAAQGGRGLWRWILANRQVIGVMVAAAAGLNWAGAIVWLRGAGADVDPVAAVFVRMPAVLAVFWITALVWPRSSIRRREIDRQSVIAMAVFGVVGMGFASLLIMVAIQEVGAGEAVSLLSTGPLFGLPLAVIFLRERITRWAIVGTVIAVVGIVLIA